MSILGIQKEVVRSKLEAYLIEKGKLSEDALKNSITISEPGISGLGDILAKTGLVSDVDIAQAYSDILDLPLLKDKELENIEFSSDTFKESYLRAGALLPLAESDSTITTVTANPEDTFSIEAMALASGKNIQLKIGTAQQIEKGLNSLYGNTQSQMDGIIKHLDSHDENDASEVFIDDLLDQAADAPIVKLVNFIIEKAVEARASDIHFEPFENKLKVRYRIDGILQLTESPPAHSTAAVVSRIKLMAKLNVAERRLPQDGAMQIRIQGKLIDIRISTTPTLHGESLVLRILDQNNIALELIDLGFSEEQLSNIHNILKSPHGIVLVTGPTGSGKTTTLYAALKVLNTDEQKIMTVEDPVEYQLEGINQIQAKPEIGLDFSQALRSIVRQDPDIIMIGEMRDLTTAKTAVQSALTGHLVLSTLHTNDAGSSITRLLDMGIENYLTNSTLNAVIAQRLIRRLCQYCKEEFTPPAQLITQLGLDALSNDKNIRLYRAKGCANCEHTGYKGRIVIAEILRMTDKLRQEILQGADASTLQKIAIADGMSDLKTDGLTKALAGITTIEEVARVSFL
ncbi:MAG: type II secretion system protein GspE [SAR86 cluster bacterium]|uniref:Type II secretion system protein E n=1 Tax=SAR86 cluster bacterium TaxID=2030880 RepID=A0A2A5C880_9GAMM|nr:MAG: type II secretion system protein GspE [SAR86 cluster bacterium]